MKFRGLLVVLVVAVFCATPLASARPSALGDNATAEAMGPDGAHVNYDDGGFSCLPPSGSLFALGDTPVSCVDSGSQPAGDFTVHVVDTTDPVVTAPASFSVNTGNPNGTSVSYGPATATDAVSDSLTPSCTPPSGSHFDLGTTPVTCTATDSSGNTGSAGFSVTVNLVDMTPPTIAVPANIVAEATGSGGASVGFVATATDDVDPPKPASCSPASGTTFGITTTTVTCNATDAAGNPADPKSFTVTVRDTTGPTINTPANISTAATGLGGATVNYGPVTATDVVDGSINASCSPPSGTTFGVGIATVICNAQDSRGNHASATSFSVTVTDNVRPTVSVPGNVTAEADSSGGAHVSYGTVTATDNVDGSLTPTCSPASGSLFAFGDTPVTCTATDSSNNTGSATFTVTVKDTTPPTLSLPANQTIEATSPLGAVATFTATASDSGGTPSVTCTPASGSTFPIHATTVNCTAGDGHGNSTSGQFQITVRDSVDPVLSLPSDKTAEATSPSGAPVTFSVGATDLGQSLPVNCNHASGDIFPIAFTPTTVTCTADDGRGNTSTGSFHVTVRDTIHPVLTVPADKTVEATATTGAVVSFTAGATDLGQTLSVTCTPPSGSTFGITTTTVNCSTNDGRGNTTSGSFSVSVVDTTPPTISNLPADITVEANGPDGSRVNYGLPTGIDLGTPFQVPCTPPPNTTFQLGTTPVTCLATDGHGNHTSATFNVNVIDTTPPTLIPPGDTSVYATTDAGIPAAEGGASQFVLGSHVGDIADPNPKVTADAPLFFTVGTTTVTFTAVDASGNKSTAKAKLTVLPKPAPGTTPPPLPPPSDNRPPGNVSNVQARAGDGRIIMKWTNPTDADFDHVEITRTTGTGPGATRTTVYSGKGTTFTDKGLQNDVEVRYVISSVDKSGNHSSGVAVIGVPKRALLRAPADGASLKKLPTQFTWIADPKATYYNLQLYAGGSLLLQSTSATPRKVMSVFPSGTVYKFKSPWKWEGKTYTMTKGIYTWYIWPGYGAREDVKYGRLMGAATFQVTPPKAKPKPKPKPKKKP